ncbi:MAG: AAA family ATPase [Chloroflexi bacterium]|nr:AAA family ATPase [Chloroflexota bacterium]
MAQFNGLPASLRIEGLAVKNFRVFRDLRLGKLTPLAAFLGPNGSGKSTVLDVFAFLSESFSGGLDEAWEQRGRFKELRSRGSMEPVIFELKYREKPRDPLMTYHLAIEEDNRGPYIIEEWLQRGKAAGKSQMLLEFKQGTGSVLDLDATGENGQPVPERLADRDILAVSAFGQISKYPLLSLLRRFISGWYVSRLTSDDVRAPAKSGLSEHLSPSGDNLAQVIQYMQERHPATWQQIIQALRRRVPQLEQVNTFATLDNRLELQIKDAPFAEFIPAQYASEGTLKLLAYLIILYNPEPPPLIGIEEPESHLHPRLLPILADECREASGRTQLLITTHSPFFINGLRPEEVWALYRGEDGYAQARRAADMRGIKEFMAAGALLGSLWTEGYFEVGDPLESFNGSKHLTKLPS